MAERLEQDLVDLGQHIAYPTTPDLASRVRRRLASAEPSRPSVWQHWLGPRPRLVLAGLVTLMLVVAAVLTVSPTARQAVAARLGLRGASIEQVPRLLTPTVGSPGAALNLGEATSLENARTRVPLLLPTLPGLEEPDGIYLATAGGTPRVSLVYAGRGGLPAPTETGVSLLIMESSLPSGFDPIVLRKSAGPATRVEELTINGGRGVWLEGAPHVLFLPDARGQFREDQVRLAANVLLWEQRGLLLRLEGSLPRDQAVQIASSVR